MVSGSCTAQVLSLVAPYLSTIIYFSTPPLLLFLFNDNVFWFAADHGKRFVSKRNTNILNVCIITVQ